MSGMNGLTLTWLGQSGFLLDGGGLRIACDLYLSDYCKQRSKLDHTRLMPAPLAAETLGDINHYLITHAHIDHFDPLTVGPVLQASRKARFYCPPAGMPVIDEFFPQQAGRFSLLESFSTTELAPGARLIPLPAAHEELQKDAQGEYLAFSYLLLFDATRQAVFFAGDTIPYEGQAKNICEFVPEGYALTLILPVNGRDAKRAALGFKGNLTLDEAVQLYHACGAALLVPCHFGMFALNDIPQPLTEEYFLQQQCHAIIPVPLVPVACADQPGKAVCGQTVTNSCAGKSDVCTKEKMLSVAEMFSLRGKTALVTGSSRGIGRAIARALAAAGADVIIHGSHDDEVLRTTVAEITAGGGKAHACAADLGDLDAVRRLAKESAAFTGKLDILVLNASVQSYQTIEDFTPEELSRQAAVNLQSSFLLIQAALPGMKERRWGRLLAIGSVNQWKPSAKLAIYAAGKCALSNLMMNCAKQYAPFGITANNLAPGVITTDRNREALKDEAYKQKILDMIPAARFGTPEECAGLALLLCSDAGAYLTGADIPVTGGMHL